MQLCFRQRSAWRAWLARHHQSTREVWLVFYKAHTGKPALSYEEAIEEALCFGWIDSLIKRLDGDRYLRKFTPRTDSARWSATNLRRVERLVREGRMTPAGTSKLAPGVKAEVPPVRRFSAVPPFFKQALTVNPKAAKHFASLPPSQRRLFVAWVASARREATRQRRLEEALRLLERNQKLGLK